MREPLGGVIPRNRCRSRQLASASRDPSHGGSAASCYEVVSLGGSIFKSRLHAALFFCPLYSAKLSHGLCGRPGAVMIGASRESRCWLPKPLYPAGRRNCSAAEQRHGRRPCLRRSGRAGRCSARRRHRNLPSDPYLRIAGSLSSPSIRSESCISLYRAGNTLERPSFVWTGFHSNQADSRCPCREDPHAQCESPYGFASEAGLHPGSA